jgi:hypothetical protein
MAQDKMARDQASPVSAAAKRWQAFVDRVERLKSYESLKPFPHPMKLWFGAGKPTRLLYFTKPAFIDWLWRQSLFPKHWLAIERYSIPTQETIDTLRFITQGFHAPVVFVGDLRPIDLTAFALLRRGTTSFSSRAMRPLPITYAGVDDRWLTLSNEFRRPGKVMPESRMGDIELEHLNLLETLAPGLPGVVGDRSWMLLKSGHDVLLEMTYNIGGYRSGYLKRLIKYLNGAAERAKRRSAAMR